MSGKIRLVEVVCAAGIGFGGIGLILSIIMRDQVLSEDSLSVIKNMFMIITCVYVLDIKRGMEK